MRVVFGKSVKTNDWCYAYLHDRKVIGSFIMGGHGTFLFCLGNLIKNYKKALEYCKTTKLVKI